MQYKVVPEPRDLDVLAAVHRAVPLVPGSVDDCCARVLARTDVAARDDARAWLTFLEALELVEATDRGYRRTRREVTADALAPAFRDRVYLADRVIEELPATGAAASVDAVFAAVRDRVPRWERRRHDDWAAVWRERVRRLLEWGVLFGLAERGDAGYRRAEPG